MSCPREWDLSPEAARAFQKELAASVLIRPLPDSFEVLGASDIGYVPALNRLVAVVLTFRWPSLQKIESASAVAPIRFPYIPGLLSFREIPPLLDAYQKLERKPDILLCDGQGIAHPRKLGLASHLGLCLDIPTVGCAKKRLCGKHEELPNSRGSYVPLLLGGEVVGYVFRSRDGVKPVYISPGHLADLETSRKVIRECLGRYRIPEPLRQAHQLATQLRASL
ncbi:MAG: deoxyribonuclease V [Syntrophobacteraceae bacterium]